MLERKKHAHVAARWVERSDECDDQERPECSEGRESESRRRHQYRSGEEQRAIAKTIRVQADPQRQRTGAQQRGGRDDADLERCEAQREQIDGKEEAHVAVAERAERSHEKKPTDVSSHLAAIADPPSPSDVNDTTRISTTTYIAAVAFSGEKQNAVPRRPEL